MCTDGKFGKMVNGNATVKRISFYNNGTWDQHVKDISINLDELNIDNAFQI